MYSIPAGVSALSFDIWATLLKGNKAFTVPRLQLIFELLGHSAIDGEVLRGAYLQADRFYNKESEITGLDYGMWERLQSMYVALGITTPVPDPDKVSAIQAEVGALRLQEQYMPSFIEPDLPATLAALRDCGYRLGLLSNTGMDNQQVMEPILAKLGIYDFFEVKIFSSADGRAKPNPDLFRRVAKEFDVQPKAVLHIGDNTNADYRATEAGLHAVLYAPNGSELVHITTMKELLG